MERKEATREANRRFGMEVKPEQSFRAQVDFLYNHPDFHNLAQTLFDRYWASSDEQERSVIMDETCMHYEECRDRVMGKELVRKMSERGSYTNLNTTVRGVYPYEGCRYMVVEKDIPVIESMVHRTREHAAVLQGQYDRNPKSCDLSRALGQTNLNQDDFTRAGMAFVLEEHRSRWKMIGSMIRAVRVAVLGDSRTISDFGKGTDFCADSVAVGRVLADELGYVTETRRKKLHQYMQFRDGAIFSPVTLFNFRTYSGYSQHDIFQP